QSRSLSLMTSAPPDIRQGHRPAENRKSIAEPNRACRARTATVRCGAGASGVVELLCGPGPRRLRRRIMKPKTLAIVAALIALLLLCPGARAAYPDRPIKLVVASPAGSPPDVMARLVSDKMAALLGQPVVVDNRPGAGGTIGSKSVATAE